MPAVLWLCSGVRNKVLKVLRGFFPKANIPKPTLDEFYVAVNAWHHLGPVSLQASSASTLNSQLGTRLIAMRLLSDFCQIVFFLLLFVQHKLTHLPKERATNHAACGALSAEAFP
jgi:hypothetical protein